jgi:hypothetical protein
MTTEKPTKKLNLDEIFGVDRPILIELKGVQYPLLRPESMPAERILRWERMEEGMRQISKSEIDDETKAAKLEAVIVDLLEMVCGTPKLPVHEMSFLMKTTVLEFYTSEIGAVKNAPAPQPENLPTGETSSPS